MQDFVDQMHTQRHEHREHMRNLTYEEMKQMVTGIRWLIAEVVGEEKQGAQDAVEERA